MLPNYIDSLYTNWRFTMILYRSYIQVIIVTKNNSTIDHVCNDIIAYYALYLYDNKNKNEVLLQVLRRVYITTWLNTFAIKHLNEKKENVECRSHLHINPFYMTTCVKVFSQNVQLPVKFHLQLLESQVAITI